MSPNFVKTGFKQKRKKIIKHYGSSIYSILLHLRVKKITVFLLSASYAFMMECWKQNPDERPSFQELVERLERTMTEQVEYLDLKQLDETKAYYQVQESKTGERGGDSGLGMHRAVSLISIDV